MEDYSIINFIEFKNENKAILYQGENHSPTFRCVYDFTKRPIWIDMTVKKKVRRLRFWDY